MTSDSIQLIHGDARLRWTEVIQDVDRVITDPPYGFASYATDTDMDQRHFATADNRLNRGLF